MPGGAGGEELRHVVWLELYVMCVRCGKTASAKLVSCLDLQE